VGKVLEQGFPVIRVAEPPVRGQRQLPVRRQLPRITYLVVDNEGMVAASDNPGWNGMYWRPLLDRLVKSGAEIETIVPAGPEWTGDVGDQDADEADGAAEAAP
jgi:hypothetical protein